MRSYLSFLFLVMPLLSIAQPKIMSSSGKEISFEQLVDSLALTEVVLYGEFHDDSLTHDFQLRLAEALLEKKDSALTIGGEFFEADDQIIIDEYLQKFIEYRHFVSEAKLWPNFEKDYKPILDLCLSANIDFIASNVPRRYAAMVARSGISILDSIDPAALNWMVPLPFEVDLSLPGYQAFYEMGHGGSMNPENMIYAQALKDATMAWFINQNYTEAELFLHINGAYHSNNFEGIYWYLNKYNPDLKVKTISTVYEGDDYKGVADFVIMIPRQGQEVDQK